jgi:hypothetical protein
LGTFYVDRSFFGVSTREINWELDDVCKYIFELAPLATYFPSLFIFGIFGGLFLMSFNFKEDEVDGCS